MPRWRNEKTDNLFRAILALKNIEECQDFFRDLLTLDEIKEFSNRWQIAQMIAKEIPYKIIRKETGAGVATISRVATWLHRGAGGYKLILKRLNIVK